MKLIKDLRAISILITLLFTSFISAEEKLGHSNDCEIFDLAFSCVTELKPAPKPAPKPIIKPSPRTNYIKDELILLYRSGANVNNIAKKYNLKTIEKVDLASVKTGMILAKTQGQNALSLSKKINNKETKVTSTTNNTFKVASTNFGNAYSMYETGVNLVHKTTKGKGVTICMIDTPIDIFHPDFSDALIETLDFVDYDPNDLDTMLHGTSVASVLVSQNQYIGIAPKAKLYAIGAFSTTNNRPYVLQGTSSNIAKALNSCIQHNVDVINLSFTGGRDALVEKLVNKAIEKGIIIVAAGGNGGHWGSTIYPALIPGVMAATAVDNQKHLYKLADKGSFIDYAAPGVNVLTMAPGGKYKLVTGTSFAAAHVSGVTALLLSQGRSKLIDKTLAETAVDLGKPGRDEEFGEGLINADRALNIFKNNQ